MVPTVSKDHRDALVHVPRVAVIEPKAAAVLVEEDSVVRTDRRANRALILAQAQARAKHLN